MNATTERLDVVLDDITLGPAMTVGALQRERRGSADAISFAYDRDYLARPHSVAIDPELHLLPGHSYPARGHATHPFYRLVDRQAKAIEQEVREAINGWRTQASALKLPRTAQGQLASTIDAQHD
jgi:hypothetical protein